jgi:pimeloyl-ACP methyl ester carboxylesterase
VAALRLQLWQVLLLVPTPFLFWLSLGTYTAIVLAAMLGGIGYALLGAVRALTGDERAYPRDWPARARPVPVAVAPDQRERRARWALGALIVAALLRWLMTRLAT